MKTRIFFILLSLAFANAFALEPIAGFKAIAEKLQSPGSRTPSSDLPKIVEPTQDSTEASIPGLAGVSSRGVEVYSLTAETTPKIHEDKMATEDFASQKPPVAPSTDSVK